MKILNLDNLNNKKVFLPKDKNGREVFIYNLKDGVFFDKYLFYPEVYIYSKSLNKVFNPIREKVMSLSKLKNNLIFDEKINLKFNKEYIDPVFYFIFNVENYYHFVYDALPYLISFLHLKKKIKNLKLLTNFSIGKNSFFDFVSEFFELIGISKKDILIVDSNRIYKNIYLSSSYTHEKNSNKPPRQEIYNFYNGIVKKTLKRTKKKLFPKNIYISRRTWTHNNLSNIGTNYTNRRKLLNENKLVEILSNNGYVEVFTENMSIKDKIQLFYNAEKIIGPIGGGMCNALFCSDKTKLKVLLSPGFLEVNKRFTYCFKNLDTIYYDKSKHSDSGKYKKYMRVKYNNIIGEIKKIYKDSLLIYYTDQKLAGWNNDLKYKNIRVKKNKCQVLDLGLNSEWILDLKNIKYII